MQILALAARGTLDLVAAECRALQLPIVGTTSEGVDMELNAAQIARGLVHLRIATRLLLRLGGFEARDGESLYEGASTIRWTDWLDADSTFAVHASGDLIAPEGGRRGLDNHIFVALRVKDALADQLTHVHGRRPNVDRDDPEVRIVVRGRAGKWQIFLDLSAPPLHQRGFRVQPGPAPLKETLAAAVVECVDWRGAGRLHDPMCGSGTLIIEALNRHLGIAPGCTRWFGVERWPHHGAELQRLLDAEREAAQAHAETAIASARGLDVLASDIDPNSLAAARANLTMAGLQDLVRVQQVDALKLPVPPPGTVLVANPPYGERLGGSEVTGFYRALGRAWRGFPRTMAHIIDGNPDFVSAFGLRADAERKLWNGPIAVTLRRYPLGG